MLCLANSVGELNKPRSKGLIFKNFSNFYVFFADDYADRSLTFTRSKTCNFPEAPIDLVCSLKYAL